MPGAVHCGVPFAAVSRALWKAASVHWAAAPGSGPGVRRGMVPGLLKRLLNVNEVIASIMMNYTACIWLTWIVKYYKPLFNNLRNNQEYISTARIPKMGMDRPFLNPV